MASKPKSKLFKSSYEDKDLFDLRKKPARGGSGNRSSADDDDLYSMLAEAAKGDGGDVEESDISEADPIDILKSLKDMDDMDADLFASKKKPSSAPTQTKLSANKPEGTDEPTSEWKKPSSAPSSTIRSYKKPTLSDDDDGGGGGGQTPYTKVDPLADLLDDLSLKETKAEPEPSTHKAKLEKSVLSPAVSPIIKREKVTTPKKQDELTFDDDDDLMTFDTENYSTKKKESVLSLGRESREPPQKTRTKLDEILERGTSPRHLERPPTGERKDQPPLQKQQQEKTSTTKEPLLEDDLTFGSYQPTLSSTPEGRQSRRQSVRFSKEDVSASSPEKKPKSAIPATPTTPTSTRPRSSADWLGLKTNDEYNYLEDETKEQKTPKTPSSAVEERGPSLTGSGATSAINTEGETLAPENKVPMPEVPKSQKKDEEEDDWLTGVLSRKKGLVASNSEARRAKQEDSLGLGEEMNLESVVSKQVSSSAPRSREDTSTSIKEPRQPSHTAHSTPVRDETSKQETIPANLSSPPQPPSLVIQHTLTPHPDTFLPTVMSPSPATFPAKINHEQTFALFHPSNSPPEITGPLSAPASRVSHPQPQPQSQSQPHHFTPHQDSRAQGWPSQAAEPLQWQQLSNPKAATLPSSTWSIPQQSQMQNTATAVQQQMTLSADSVQQLLLQQQMMQSQLLSLAGVVDAGSLHPLRVKEQQSGEHQALQARIIQLEGQIRTLQLERDQSQMLLENVQQRHKQDVELLENTHKARVKLLEESAAQREARAQQECEDLMERLATVTRLADQERSELQAQHQRRLAQSQQDRDREVERLRDLQRKSILEMKKDHEDQVQRLKRLKDEEIDAVTSATSQTRSLTVVIEQMEQFSVRLGDLSSRVESTHEHTAQGLEQGARQRDEQLRMLQERLGQQQRAMAEERAQLKEVIARMNTQLAEQQRQLEKERWKVTAEQAKAESIQRGLEEEKRSLTMHINMEREELERAKTALLEEQQSVMQHCTEERRKLAAEWAQFHTQEKQRQERAEREASKALERDAQREGSIISLAQEQADLKLRAGELKQKEAAVLQDREALERQREELGREKERLSITAVRLKTRAQEVETFSKLATDKYEEGEQALQRATHIETEHKARLTSIHSQTERLRQQEQQLLQERMRMTALRREMERLRQGLPITHLPQMMPPVFTDYSSMLPNAELTSTLNITPLTSVASPQSIELQARLARLKHTAEKDRDYLQDEQFFLDTLKKSSYSFHTD
ncbi:fas-binding factor 1 isoform X1 [Myripristis murdjan]|uniref:fas-binding factor 1 isoform X1 n=1 Tax=Myripristis murdjan TaxID=586833 RepID=UPI001175E022|nr:fas-binding factor 1 isoform X1 [Myripristis murdjan]